MKLLHIKVEPSMKQEIEQFSKQFHFASTTEFVREAIRARLEAYKRQEAFSQLQKQEFSGTRPSTQERAAIVDELFERKNGA